MRFLVIDFDFPKPGVLLMSMLDGTIFRAFLLSDAQEMRSKQKH